MLSRAPADFERVIAEFQEKPERAPEIVKQYPGIVKWRHHRNGESMLHYVVVEGRSLPAKALIAAGADPNDRSNLDRTALHDAVLRGHGEMVALLLAADADSNAQCCRDGETPLSIASSRGDVRIVEMLLRAGANPNKVVASGMTALHEAAASVLT